MDRYDWWPHMMNNGVDLREFQKFNWHSHVINPKNSICQIWIIQIGIWHDWKLPKWPQWVDFPAIALDHVPRGGSKSQVMQLKKWIWLEIAFCGRAIPRDCILWPKQSLDIRFCDHAIPIKMKMFRELSKIYFNLKLIYIINII